MATFDLWQQAYTLAQQSGTVSARMGTPDELAAALALVLDVFYKRDDTVQAIGQWSTAWGPAVFESEPGPTSYADNVMYAATNEDNSVYLVGIAGTSPNSKYDINQEDLAVNTTVAWTAAFPTLQPYTEPGGLDPYLSTGTALGVNNLLGMVDIFRKKQSLLAFLGALPSSTTKQATLILAGHSLAGALSPTLALALFNPNGGKLSLSNWANVYVYPTAGPTPGNADFGQYLASVFPPSASEDQPTYQVWNRNVMNTIDVVPHAWEIDMLDAIPTLYPTSWKQTPFQLTVALNYAKGLSNQGGKPPAGPYMQFESEPLPGTLHGEPVANFDQFKAQALYQHTTAYDVLLDVTSLSPGANNQAAYIPVIRAMLSGPEGGE